MLEPAERESSDENTDAWPAEMGGKRVWTVRGAFLELARQQCWHPSQGEELARKACAHGSGLFVRDPHGLHSKADNLSLMLDRLFTSDVNDWLESRRAPYRMEDDETAKARLEAELKNLPAEEAARWNGAEGSGGGRRVVIHGYAGPAPEPQAATPSPAPVVRETTEQPAPAQSTATPVPLVTASASDMPATQGNIMKKAALIAELEYEWSSIEADISDATRNGLKAAAHTGKHGEWDKDKARAWAVSKGKIKRNSPVHSLAAAWPGGVTRNTIGDR